MKNSLIYNYRILLLYFACFIIFAFTIDTPISIFTGLKNIILQPDILITDYLEISGIGASFVNSATLCIIYILILIRLKVKLSGSIVAGLFTVCGFSLFGKNLLNVWPLFLGTWLYSKYQKEPFSKYILVALFGSTLSPAVSQLSFSGHFETSTGLIIGISLGIFMGFILPPISSYCLKMHEGFNLYNSGFAAGLVGTFIMSILRSFGINFEQRLLWSTKYTTVLLIFLSILFLSMILVGFCLNDFSFKNLDKIYKHSGKPNSDYYLIYGEGSSFINMGILGLIFMVYILIVDGPLNGPIIAGIFTIVGFGAFGKHFKNTIPVVLGTVIAGILNIWSINSPSMLLATLFSTTLAPISGYFGPIYGVIAGFLHTCIVMNIGHLHAGLNLYNNGFSGGFVAIILIPIITNLKKVDTQNELQL
ncbi:hypothetical protein K144313037_00310 [Clostridium tetani]|uniref:Conserved protein n=2 Tax=Clostridium tetani TaxID=1513 RepID=Q899U8_CLOTE|nr:DUF1576 domain-containing protein [Clostridium tetani]AAO34723.1 conserved protein [Clostridium tetani E88]AVP55974.1 DUF1576 domain-containing protein [Clostridium tetani]KGI36459.1 membrane protein [Clostridium tetani ATCC 9441]KGI37227.1 membrane protein [Clostridium tetani]KGI41977.1 membrane protein [Clostridium tetani]